MGAAQINSFDVKIVKNENYITANLVGKATTSNVEVFNQLLPQLLVTPALDVIINCQHLNELSVSWIRSLMTVHQKLKQENKQMRLIYVHEGIQNLLKQEGVQSSLRSMESLQAALIDVGLKTGKSLDVNFINPFLTATIKVLETQASTKLKAGTPFKKEPKDKFMGDISGVIGLISEAFSGSVVISFPADTFLKIMSRMLGEEYTTVTKEITDGAGELTNIIFGQAKVLLNEQGFGIKTAIPSVITGQDHAILPMSSGPRMVVPFETDVGPFFIEICVTT